MRGADESRRVWYPTVESVISPAALRALVIFLCLGAIVTAVARDARPASASAPTTLASGFNATRTTIPVAIEGQRASCVLDTGSSAILVSPALAQAAHLQGRAGTFEVAPDGRTYVDRQTDIAHFGVAGYTLRDVPALISSNLTGYSALCGYDFFTHFPTLIDRAHRVVTLYPSPSKLARLHCLTVNLAPHVPLATVEINGTWLSHVVLDSGMAGGGALWDGVRSQLREPLASEAAYRGAPPGTRDGFACGAVATVRYAGGAPASAMPICTEAQRPDGYNGIIETNLSSVAAIAVDYPHRKMCFDVAAYSQVTAAGPAPSFDRGAWSRFNYLRPP
jgi:predicted aspartyl protease